MYNQLSVENAIAKSAVATIAEIVANDNVTAEHGIFISTRKRNLENEKSNEIYQYRKICIKKKK